MSANYRHTVSYKIPNDRFTVRYRYVILFILLCLTVAFADFSTKGEPREALVAVDMLRSGNWILPIDQNGDMAYKPPMFHWLVALFSLPFGHVSEFTSRLPSVLALTLLIWMTEKFCGLDRFRQRFGLMAAALCLTSFEVFRAGTVCRVDMVLTAFMVGAMIALFLASLPDRSWKVYIWAVLLMSGAVITKGPVGTLLPIGAWWVYRLLVRRDNFLKITGMAVLLLVGALIIPLLWYWAAYCQGGERFLNLALEENFGRFTGSMSYESHVKPLWYNFTSLLTGWLPWSALMLLTAIWLLKKRYWPKPQFENRLELRHPLSSLREIRPEAAFSLIAALIIFIFYCIPSSKRSVYLLPMYPFMAYGIANYAYYLAEMGLLSIHAVWRWIKGVFLLFILGFGVVYPIFTRLDSDREKAEAIEKIAPEGPVYSFVPSRFNRYYITDFYLGGRIVSLVPSGQVSQSTEEPDASQMRVPEESEFILLTSANYHDNPQEDKGLSQWLESNGLKRQVLYTSDTKAHDIKSRIVLYKITHRK